MQSYRRTARLLRGISLVLLVVAGLLYVAALFSTGVAEGCQRFGGGRMGSTLDYERSYWPPEGHCSYTGPHGVSRTVVRGWTWAATVVGGLAIAGLAVGIGALFAGRRVARLS